LIIGIISAIRELLRVGARLSLQESGRAPTGSGLTAAIGEPPSRIVHNALLELGVNAPVVVGLALSLVLIRRLAGMREDAPAV
jgi:hypothetical protein